MSLEASIPPEIMFSSTLFKNWNPAFLCSEAATAFKCHYWFRDLIVKLAQETHSVPRGLTGELKLTWWTGSWDGRFLLQSAICWHQGGCSVNLSGLTTAFLFLLSCCKHSVYTVGTLKPMTSSELFAFCCTYSGSLARKIISPKVSPSHILWTGSGLVWVFFAPPLMETIRD